MKAKSKKTDGAGLRVKNTKQPATSAAQSAGRMPALVERAGAPWRVERHLLMALSFFVITLLAYSNSFHAGFAMDNKGLLLQDPRIREANSQNVALIFQHTYWWQAGEAGLYRPVTTLSYLFNYAILGNGEHSAGYHWINFFLHFGNVLLVYALMSRLLECGNKLAHSKNNLAPAIIAGLWAVHPVLTESVTNMIGRADLLAALATLGGFLMYLKSTETAGWRRVAWLTGLAALTAVGVFAKESAVTVLGAIVFYELAWWKERKRGLALFLGCLAVLLPIQVMLYQRAHVLAASPLASWPFTDNPIVGARFWAGRLTAVKVMARYLWLIVWPAKLSCDYSYSQIPLFRGTPPEWLVCLAVAAVAAVFGLMWRWNRLVFFLGCFALVTFLPSSNLLFPIGTIMAERFLYLPAAALIACLVLAIYAASRRKDSKDNRDSKDSSGTRGTAVVHVMFCVLIASLALRTWVRNRDWENDVTLGAAAVRTCPRSFKAHSLLAGGLYESDPSRAHLVRAIEEADKTIELLDALPDELNDPKSYRFAGSYHLERAALLSAPGTNGGAAAPVESLRHYQRSAQIFLRCISIRNAHHQSMTEKARERGDVVSAFDSDAADAYRLLSLAWLGAKQAGNALNAATEAVGQDPLNPEMYVNLSHILLAGGRGDEAAVTLMQGMVVTRDEGLRREAIDLYRRGLDAKGCAVIPGPYGPAIDPTCETVRRHLCAAAAPSLHTLLATGHRDDAIKLKNTFLTDYACPPAPLNELLAENADERK